MSRQTNYRTTGPSFRPSVYSTGIEELQPYHANWAEGSSYGGLMDKVKGFFADEAPDEVDDDVSFWEVLKGTVSGAVTGAGSGGYDAYLAEQARIERERAAAARKNMILVTLALGLPLSFIAYKLHKKG